VRSFRLASVLVLVRSIETVCVSTQRAFARYGAAVQISLIAKLLSLAAAGIIPFFHPSVATVLLATLSITIFALGIQLFQIGQLLGTFQLGPSFEREPTVALLSFGSLTWVQAVCGLVVGQADRIIAGFTFGAAAAASYGLCVQLAQPIWGIAAAGLHFLFPYLATQHAIKDTAVIKRTINRAIAANSVFIVLALLGILVFGVSILRVWGGEPLAEMGRWMLPAIALSTALTALSVVGCYAMLALGCARTVTLLTLTAAATMFLSIPWLAHVHGVYGIAVARLLYGPIMLLVYVPLFFLIRRSPAASASAPAPVCEEA
jgi:O-antigen/teichoic acid export membrane protein